MAKKIGVSPTYLSKVERDEFPPPAEDKVRKIAGIIGHDPDELLALAGRVASDLTEIIRERPREMADFLRAAKGLTAEDMARLAQTLSRSHALPQETKSAMPKSKKRTRQSAQASNRTRKNNLEELEERLAQQAWQQRLAWLRRPRLNTGVFEDAWNDETKCGRGEGVGGRGHEPSGAEAQRDEDLPA
jgi:transcriptional regulator with XRE-family HTH domain